MKTSTLLKRAKEKLSTGYKEERYAHIRYICIAINNVVIDESDADMAMNDKREATSYKLRKLISKRLRGYSGLEDWLHRYHNITIPRMHSYTGVTPEYIAYRNKIQATRHAWIDSLIAEYEAKGD